MDKISNITAVLIVKNEEEVLKDCLTSLVPFAEVVIYLNDSTDKSEEIARSFANTKIVIGPFLGGFGATRNAAAAHARNDWIFHIDADETVSNQLLVSIKQANFDNPHCLYRVQRFNKFLGKVLSKELLKRLYNRKIFHFEEHVHEQLRTFNGIEIDNTPVLAGVIYHHEPSFSKMKAKAKQYARLYADSGKPRRSFIVSLVVILYKFFLTYLIKGRIFKGKAGILHSYLICYQLYLRYRLPRG